MLRPTTLTAMSIVAALTGSAFAAPLNLVGGLPDASAGFIKVTYNAGTGAFSATGLSQNLNFPGFGINNTLGNKLFTLQAVIDNAGNASSASLEVRGNFITNDRVLFKSNRLQAFGFGATRKFEFVFLNDTGEILPVNGEIGVILIGNGLSFAGGVPSFGSSFNNQPNQIIPATGNADTFFIPTPGAAALGFVGLLAAGRRRR
ncbi:MAG: MYXO-CTERM sorting domain-containing protein [Phycisphaerales bacterium]